MKGFKKEKPRRKGAGLFLNAMFLAGLISFCLVFASTLRQQRFSPFSGFSGLKAASPRLTQLFWTFFHLFWASFSSAPWLSCRGEQTSPRRDWNLVLPDRPGFQPVLTGIDPDPLAGDPRTEDKFPPLALRRHLHGCQSFPGRRNFRLICARCSVILTFNRSTKHRPPGLPIPGGNPMWLLAQPMGLFFYLL